MSRGLGRVQVAILDHLHARRGDNHIGGPGEPLFILGPGIHDMRHVAEEMTRQRGFSEPRLQAVFSRAVRRLVERGHLEPLSMVPISFDKPNLRYSRFVYELTDARIFSHPVARRGAAGSCGWSGLHRSLMERFGSARSVGPAIRDCSPARPRGL